MKKIRMDKLGLHLERMAVWLILGLVLAFMLVLCFSAYTETSYLNTNNASGENIDIYSDNLFLNIILLTLYLAIIYLYYEFSGVLRLRTLYITLFSGVFVFGVLFIVSTKLAAPVYSDSFIVTNAAMEAAQGSFQPMEIYFARFPFQLGYVMYQEAVFRVLFMLLPGLPEGYYCLALQGLNLLWLLVAYFAILRSLRLVTEDEGILRLCILFLFFAIQPSMSCTFLYGNIPAFSFGMLAIWMFLAFMKKGKLYCALLCALFLTLAVALKLNLMIFLVAIGGIWFIELVKRFSLRSAICLVLCAASVLSLSKLPQDFYEKRSGLEFGEGIPMVSWLAMGLSEGHAAAGWYKEDNTVTAFKETGNDPEATGERAKQVIMQRAEFFSDNPGEALSFFSEKLRSQWNEPSYDALWLNQVFISYSEKGGLYTLFCDKGEQICLSYMNQQQQIIFLGALLGVLALLKKKDILSCIFTLVILGGLLYHLFFEAKSQYALPYFILMMPVASIGFAAFFERMKKAIS